MIPEIKFASTESPAGPSALSLIGVGGAGGRIAEAVGRRDAAGVTTRAVDSDAGALARLGAVAKSQVGGRVTRGFGCGGDAAHAGELAEGEAPALRELVAGGGLVVLALGLGGGAGSGMAPVLARLARDAGSVVVAVATLPFEFEGRLRRTNAEHALSVMKAVADAVICVPLQGVGTMLDAGVPVTELMARADEIVAEVAAALLQVVSRSALLPLGLGDLERLLRGRQSEGVAAVARAAGEGRVAELWAQLEQHPFLKAGTRLANAEALLLHVVGGPELRLEDLEFLQREAAKCAPRAQLVVGVATDPAFAGRLQGLLVAARGGIGIGLAPAGGDPPPPGSTSRRPERPMIFEDGGGGSSADRTVGPGRVPAEGGLPGVPKAKPGPTARTPRQQQQFDFNPASRGLFDHSESTLLDGENLDEPTYARRGVKLN